MPKNYIAFYAFCNTQKESDQVKKIINRYDAKYFVAESKALI